MKIVIAPDSFKGSATSAEIAQWMENGIHSIIPNCETVKIAIGDGGEGTLNALLAAGFTTRECVVMGPVGNAIPARFGIREKIALVELAEASGLQQLPHNELAPMSATSFGTGELILGAMDAGATTIILAVGGSACTDGGAGALQALGARLLNNSGQEIALGGGALSECVTIDLSGLDPRISTTHFILACDVDNPLLGPHGAASVYSPQKGATSEQVQILEKSLAHFASIAGDQHIHSAGAGAAGGFGYMAMTFLSANRESGVEIVLSLNNFRELIHGANLIITGEGQFDAQSLSGKAPLGVMRAGANENIPVIMVCGRAQLDGIEDRNLQFKSIIQLSEFESDLGKCISNPQPIIEKIGEVIARSLIG